MRIQLILKYFFLSILVFPNPSNLTAQLYDIDIAYESLAQKLKEQFSESNHYGLESKSEITFDYDKNSSNVTGQINTTETLLCLSALNSTYYGFTHINDQISTGTFYTVNSKGKRVRFKPDISKYKSNNIFYDDISLVSFNLNFNAIGDRSNYHYTSKYKDVKYLTKNFFHTNHPIKNKTITYTIPEWLEIELIEVNFDGFEISKNETRDKNGNIVITFTLNDLAPILNEKFSSGYATSLPHLLVIAKRHTYNDETITLFESTKDLYSWYNFLLKQVDNDPTEISKTVDELTATITTDEEKIESIFYWVQDNIRYIAYEDGIMGFKPASAQEVFNKKFGDCKGMANLTYEMLKVAGYDARRTWIGTRSIPYTYEIPSLAVDNHMICTVYLNDKKYFLDATEKGIALGNYAYRIQGQDVLIENGDSYIIDSIPDLPAKYNLRKEELNLALENGRLIGTGKSSFSGEENVNIYRYFNTISEKDRQDKTEAYISNRNKNISISNIQASNFTERELPSKISYNVELKNQISTFDNYIYINTESNTDYSNWDVEKDRINDLNFGYKINQEKKTTIILPPTYKVDYLPEQIDVINEEFSILVKITHNSESNELIYIRQLIINNGFISSAKVEQWNSLISKLNKFYSDQIILIKQ